MAIGAHHIRECHLHGVQRLADELWHVLVCHDRFDAAATDAQPCGVRQRFRGEVSHFLSPVHAPVLEEGERGLMSLSEVIQNGEHVQRDQILRKNGSP